MTIATAFLAVLFILPAAYALDYTVGDSAGWVQGMDYTTWASGKTFSTGDTLVFNYGGSHSVDMVSEADYDNCGIGNALESYNDGNTIIPLNKSGSMYFICPVFGHCTGGMKLAITVSAGAANTPSDALPATPTATPIPTSPSTIVPNPIPTTPSTTLTPTLPFTATTPTPAPIADTPTALTPNADPDTPSAITPTPIPDTPSAITPTPTTLSTVTPIPTTPTLTAPSTPTPFLVPNGAFSNLYNMNYIVLGASIVLAPLLAFMG